MENSELGTMGKTPIGLVSRLKHATGAADVGHRPCGDAGNIHSKAALVLRIARRVLGFEADAVEQRSVERRRPGAVPLTGLRPKGNDGEAEIIEIAYSLWCLAGRCHSAFAQIGSRTMGQVMQCAPPRPRLSSAPSTAITSTPARLNIVFVYTFRS